MPYLGEPVGILDETYPAKLQGWVYHVEKIIFNGF